MSSGTTPDRATLAAGERVLLVDRKGRRYLVRLVAGSSFHTHAGVVDYDVLIGQPEGITVEARTAEDTKSGARRFVVVRPTLADVVLKMPRSAQVIYPKDIGAILIAADVFPGARVLEAGVGSGALSMALVRAGAVVTGYEIREDFAADARRNVAAMHGDAAAYMVEERSVYDGIDERGLDRIVLDLPEPWQVVPHAEQALLQGGIMLSYLPTINQTAELRERLEASSFGMMETFEILRRTWHVEGRSVRPDHAMVGHTGFITTARLLSPSR